MARAFLAEALCFLSVVHALRAIHAPFLVEEPTDTVASSAGRRQPRSATLFCRGNYDSTLVVEWYMDGVAVQMASLPNYTITDTSLVVAATDPEDDGRDLEGMYYCVISNAFGAVRSRSALVKTQRLVGFVNPGGKVFHSDERVAFVQVLYSSDKSPFQWSITCLRKTYVCSNAGCPLHRVVSVVGRLLGFFALSFTYNDIKLIPGCTSTAVSVSVNTKEYTVSFTDPQFKPRNPLKGLGIQNVAVELGDNATLYCIYNHPNSTYKWKHNSSLIHVVYPSRYSLVDGVLQIQDVLQTDVGLYSCEANATYKTELHSRKIAKFNLTVYSLPKVNLTLAMQDGNLSTNCNAVISTVACRIPSAVSSFAVVCQFDGSVPLVVQILHNASVIFGQNVTDNQTSVQLYREPNQSGVYQCLVNNPYGSTQKSLYVSAQDSAFTSSTVAFQALRPSTPITRRAGQTAQSIPPSSTQPHSSITVPFTRTATPATLDPTISNTVSQPASQLLSVHSNDINLASTPKKFDSEMPSSTTATISELQVTYTVSHIASMYHSLPNPSLVMSPIKSSSMSVGLPTRITSGTSRTLLASPKAVRTTRHSISTTTSVPTLSVVPSKTSAFASPKVSPTVTNSTASVRTLSVTVTPTKTPTTMTSGTESSGGLFLPAVAGGAAGGCVLLLLIFVIVYLCKRRHEMNSFNERRLKAAETLSENPFYKKVIKDRSVANSASCQETHSPYDTLKEPARYQVVAKGSENKKIRQYDVFNRNKHELPAQRQVVMEPTDNEGQQASQYDVLNRNTDDVPVQARRQAGQKDSEGEQVNEYHVLSHSTDELPITAREKPADGYSVLHETADSQPVQSYLESCEVLAARNKPPENPYELPKNESLQRSVSSSDVNYSHVITGVKRRVAESSDHVTAEVAFYVSEEQRLSTITNLVYEDIGLRPQRSVNSEEDSAYAEIQATDTGESAAPSMTEYSYARSDAVRAIKILSDRFVVGATVKEVEEKQLDNDDDIYSRPDEQREPSPRIPYSNSEYSYAKPYIKRPVLDRLAEGRDQYGPPSKPATTDKPTVIRQASNTPKRYTTGVPDAVPDKQLEKISVSTDEKKEGTEIEEEGRGRLSSLQPERYQKGEDLYAVSTKPRSWSQYSSKKDRDRESKLQTEHYQIGEDQYDVSAKSRSTSQHSNTSDQSAKGKQNSHSGLELADLESKKKHQMTPNRETVDCSVIKTAK